MTYRKPLFTILLIVCISFFSFSNLTASNIAGDKLYQQEKFAQAIKKYKQAYQKDTRNYILVEKIANCYMQLDKFSSAEYWYWKAFKGNSLSEAGSYSYMKALIANSKYRMAEEFCLKYRGKYPQTNITCPNQEEFRSLIFGNEFEVNLLDANTEKDDVSATIYQDNLYLVSNAEKVSSKSGVMKVINISELAVNSNAEVKVFKKINSINPNKGIGFHPFTGQMFYAVNKNKASNGMMFYKTSVNIVDVQSDIFEEKLTYPNDQSFQIHELTFNNEGTIAYYSSDMAGGFGGSDLYMSTYQNGVFGEPQNLGAKVNTIGDERYPAYSNGELYFSSDGLLGLGSFDIFSTKFGDYAISFKDESAGFFTSDRIGGKGGCDIYSFNKRAEIMTVFVYDKDTKEPLGDMPITLGNGKQVTTDAGGVCSIEYTEEGLENVSAQKDGFIQSELKFNENGYSVVVPMESQQGIKFMVQVLNKESGLPMEGINVQLNDFQSYTDDAGNTYWMIYPNKDYVLTAYNSKDKSVLNEKLTENFSTHDAETPDFWTATILME